MTMRVLLLLALVFMAAGCHTPPKKKKNPTPAEQGPDQSGDVTFQAFVGRLRLAVAAHDAQTVAAMMTPDFGYNIEPPLEGDGVFQYWDKNNVWPDLLAVLQQPFVPAGSYMVSPPAFAAAPDEYKGYRAGIKQVNGSWRFAYFVKD